MNGSILGMKKTEIQQNFDAIVDFSGVEKFLDTPLKHYSSGMQLRLAFAVAAFLENEILIIDEVLAVGDAEFQKKCLGKMGEVAHSGRTILFVSHDINALKQLCPKTICLKSGEISAVGETKQVLNEYLNEFNSYTYQSGYVALDGKIIKSITFSSNGEQTNSLIAGSNLKITVDFSSLSNIDFPVLGIVIRNEYDEPLIGVNNKHYQTENLIQTPINKGKIEVEFPFFPLYQGNYSLDLHFGDGASDLEVIKNCFNFVVGSNRIAGALENLSEKLNKIQIEKVNWLYK